MRALILMLLTVGVAMAVGITLAPPKGSFKMPDFADEYEAGDSTGLKPGTPSPSFAYRTVDGRTVTKKDLAGKVVLIDVFSVT